MSFRRKLLKYTIGFFGLLLLLFVLAFLLIRLPGVQTWAVNKVAANLSASLKTKATVEGVHLKFFRSVLLNGVYIEDQNQDTLIYARRLEAKISLFSFFGKTLDLEKVTLDGAFVNLYEKGPDAVLNMAFLIDAFQPDTTSVKSASRPWIFSLDQVQLTRSRLDFRQENQGLTILFREGELLIDTRKLDFDNQVVHIKDLNVKNAALTIHQGPTDNNLQPATVSQLPPASRPLATGWDLKADKITLENAQFAYRDLTSFPSKAAIDFGNLDLSIGLVDVREVSWVDERILADIREVTARDRSGFQVEHLGAGLLIDNKTIRAENIVLETPGSSLKSTSELQFNHFSDLNDLLENKVTVDAFFENSKVSFKDLDFFLTENIKETIINTASGESIEIKGQIRGTLNELKAKDLSLQIGNFLMVNADIEVNDVSDSDKLQFDLKARTLRTSSEHLNRLFPVLSLPPALDAFGPLDFKGNVRGQIGDFEMAGFDLTTSGITKISGSGRIKGLPDTDNLQMDFDIRELQTKAVDLAGFFPDSLPPQLDSFGLISYAGKFSGTLHKFGLKGHLQTAIGRAESDLVLDFNNDYSTASYEGSLDLDEFDLEKLAPPGTGIGKVSLFVKGNGNGFDPDSLQADIDLDVREFLFLNYPYRNVKAAGRIAGMGFEGKASIEDVYAKLQFDGKASIGGDLPEYRFSVTIDTLDLKNLNLTDVGFGLSTKTEVDATGHDLDNLTGSAKFYDLSMNNDSLHFQTDSIVVIAQQNGEENKQIIVRSNFLQAAIKGKYDLQTLPQTLVDFMREYFPVEVKPDSALLAQTDPFAGQGDQVFILEIALYDPIPLSIALIPELKRLDTALVTGIFDRRQKRLEINGQLANLDYNGNLLKSATITASGNTRRIKNNISLRGLEVGSGFIVPQATLSGSFRDDSLHLRLNAVDDEMISRLNIKGLLTRPDERFKFSLAEEILLDSVSWSVPPGNAVLFKENWVFVDQMSLNYNDHKLSVRSIGDAFNPALAPVEIEFRQFDLSAIAGFLRFQDATLKGEVNGGLMIKDFLTNPHYTADMNIDQLGINDVEIGQLHIEAVQPQNSTLIDVLVELDGAINELRSSGTYNTDSRQFDIQTNFPALELRVLDPFLPGLITESMGHLSGNINLGGTPEAPKIQGTVDMHNLSTIVEMANTRIRVADNRLTLNNTEIDLGVIDLFDEQDRKASLSGKFLHQKFSDFRLDLRLKTDEFQFLNTSITDNDLFYGRLLLKADLSLTGDPREPDLRIAAKTLTGSSFVIVPFLESGVVQEEDYIIFSNPEKYREGLEGEPVYQIRQPYPFNLSLILELTQEAELQFIVDPETGDKLVCRGNANLSVEMDPAGNMDVFGTYVIASGHYDFSYAQVIKRQFEIRQGSSAVFNGNPLDVKFFVTAVYTAKATTYDLIKNEASLDNEEVRDAKRRSDVEVLLSLEGDLNGPLVNFDVQVPSTQESSVTSAVNRKLSAMRANPNEMNQQVFALLLFNSFLLSNNSDILTSAGETAALSSVSKLFSTQLNKLADKFVKGVQLSVDLDSYKSDVYGGGTVTEFKVGVSKNLFNERLKVQAGGNVDLSSGSEASGLSNIVGDFLLEYDLNETGNYVLKVFRRSNFDILNDANTVRNGVSVFIKKSFDKRSRTRKKTKE